MPQIYGFSPKGNTRSLLFQCINQNIHKELTKMKQEVTSKGSQKGRTGDRS